MTFTNVAIIGLGLLGGPKWLLHRFAHLALKASGQSPNLLNGPANVPGCIGQLVRAQHEKGNEEDDEQFAAAEIPHGSMLPTSVRILRPPLGAPTQAKTGVVDLGERAFVELIGRPYEVVGGDSGGGRPTQGRSEGAELTFH